MNGLWLRDGMIELKHVSKPYVQPGDALIKILLSGICSTDLELVKGYYPYDGILGHEFVGEVVALGKNRAHIVRKWIGKRVVGKINVICEKCRLCTLGRHSHCLQRNVLGIINKNGCHAEYITLPLKNLFVVPKNVPNKSAVFTEPLAAALEIQKQVCIEPDSNVLVIGAGKLGQLISWTLALRGCKVAVVFRREKQRRLLQKYKIHHTILEKEIVNNGNYNDRYDYVIEASGSQAGFILAANCTIPGGVIILKSTYAGNVTCNMSQIVVKELTIVGSRCGPFEPALELMRTNRINPSLLIDKVYPLSQSIDAMKYAQTRGVMKILLRPKHKHDINKKKHDIKSMI